jgi:23S rRNA G2445 N2-methylase RlmL
MADAYGEPAHRARDERLERLPRGLRRALLRGAAPMSDPATDRPQAKAEPVLFATAARGTEGAVRDELRELGFRGVRADRGGVHFGRSLDEGLRACIEMRTAIRVLYRLASFDAPSGDALYEGVSAVDLGAWLTPRQTLAVRAVCTSSRLTHSQFVAQKTKDAVVDRIRTAVGARPSVDLDDPDVTLFVHVVRDRATLYLDVSGGSLHRRGWRAHAGEAPLKESLAAAVLRLSGWDRTRLLVDPMCGSGTIAVEAALWSRGVAPGLSRERFGFERWASHDEAAARRAADLRAFAREKVRPEGPPVRGSDVDLAALALARDNAREAGAGVSFRRASVRDLGPEGGPGVVVTNPPYGERLGVPEGLYEDMARAFGRLSGWRVAVLSGTPAIERAMRRRPSSSLAVWNGALECRLLVYEIE